MGAALPEAGDETERHKPDPAPVHHAIDALGARPGEAAFVGDSPHDIEAGNAAGVATVTVMAVLAGSAGNAAAGTALTFESPVAGVSSFAISAAASASPT